MFQISEESVIVIIKILNYVHLKKLYVVQPQKHVMKMI